MNEVFVEKNKNYSLGGNNVLTRRRVNSESENQRYISFTKVTSIGFSIIVKMLA